MRNHKLIAFGLMTALTAVVALPLFAADPEPLVASEGWARATVDGQPTGSAFMTLFARVDSVVVGVSSPVATTAQLHEMSMSGSTMKMHEIADLPVKAGETVKLTPTTMHVMLFGLKQTLHAGDHFPVVLSVKTDHQAPHDETVEVEVRPLGAS